MVIVQLKGGLGNQLFQYAIGREIACRNGAELKLDVSIFETCGLRSYRLNHFNIIEEFASQENIQRLNPGRSQPFAWVNSQVKRRLLPYWRQSTIIERCSTFDQDVLKAGKDTYLIGYWQSERYFVGIANLIRNEFTLKENPDGQNQRVLASIEQSNSVSIHIRRGDYVTSPEANQVHGVLGLEYYGGAVDFIASKVSQPQFFVFSDDMAWVKLHLKTSFPMVFVEHNDYLRDYEDLRLISHCKYHIIANSSFSWWGAWLSNFPNKIVIAPQRWFAQDEIDVSSSRCPPSWVLL